MTFNQSQINHAIHIIFVILNKAVCYFARSDQVIHTFNHDTKHNTVLLNLGSK